MTSLINDDFLNIFLKQNKHIIAAVSGGSDSLALMFLLHEFLQKKHEAWRLIAITVDHGLRPESAIEAQTIHKLCKKYNIKHEIFVWQGKKPETGLAAKARTARYNLLCQAAKAYDSRLIITGHTLNDQIETFQMRQMRRNKGRGLAGMPYETLLQKEFTLLRPLLHCTRDDLRAYLKSKHITWIDDPSNDNIKYERVRIRKNPDVASMATICHNIEQAKLTRKNEAVQIADLIKTTKAHWRGEQLILENINDTLLALPIFTRFLEILTALIGGAPFFKPAPKAMHVFLRTTYLTAQKMTHSSTIIEKHAHQIRLWREQRNLTTITIKAGNKDIWNGRFEVINLSKKDFIVRNPNLEEVQAALNNLQKENPQRKIRHMPSLLTSLAIEYNDKVEIPSISDNNKPPATHYQITPILLPFNWLASGHDFAMLAPLYQLFEDRITFK